MADISKTTKKGESGKKLSKQTGILLILLSAVLMVILLLVCVRSRGSGEEIETETAPVTKDSENIYLPAYEGLTFRAGVREQNVSLSNPAENDCLICASLILEDGTAVYQSELIAPGDYSQPITLIAPMERGVYRNVTLRYDCYTDDEARTPLNGAASKLDITVE